MEMTRIDLDDQGMVMPTKRKEIALIDADTIAYTACLNTEVAGEVMGRDFYSDMEWDALQLDKQFDPVEMVLWETDPIMALEKAGNKIQRILDKTGCTEFELHFSGGRENFRYTVFSEYKSNRTDRTPAGLGQLKQDMCEKFGGEIHTEYEADDAVVYKKLKDPEKYLLVAMDKDVVNSIEGTHFNYYERAESVNKYGNTLKQIDMKLVEVDKHTAMTWRYVQTLMGDKTDGIIGLHGIGQVKAEKAIANCMSHKDIWKAVVEQYKMKGRTKDEALMNLNLVDMCLLQDDGTIKLRTHEEMENA